MSMQEPQVAKPRQMILVLGMHRSGTSATTGVLARLGADLGGHLIPAAADNPKGFFEHADVFALHDKLLRGLGSAWDDTLPLPDGWATSPEAREAAASIREILHRDFKAARLAVVKDPRLCRFVPLWRMVLADEGFLLKVVLVVRDGLEVVASLAKRNALGAAEAAGAWLRHELEAEAATRGDPRVVVPYDAVLRDWRGETHRIATALDLHWPRSPDEAGAEIDAFLDSGLRHHRGAASKATGQLLPPLSDWLKGVYAALTHPDGIATGRMDEIARDVSKMDRENIVYAAPLRRLRQEVAHWRPEAERVWTNHEWLRTRVEGLEAAAADARNAGLERLQEKIVEGQRQAQDAAAEHQQASRALGEQLAAVQEALAGAHRQMQDEALRHQESERTLGEQLAAVREALTEAHRQAQDEALRHQEAERILGEHWSVELGAQRERFARDLEALREEASLTRGECETLRGAVLTSQRRLDSLQSRMQALYGRRLGFKERVVGRLSSDGSV